VPESSHNKSFILKIKNFITSLGDKIGFLTKKSHIQRSMADKTLIFSLNKSKIPSINQLRYIGKFLNKKERFSIQVSLLLIITSVVFLGVNIYKNHVTTGPAYGEEYTEGLTGMPKFINPLYASINMVDSDITSLVYSGLLKKNKDNKIVPDLAKKFEISSDQKTYTFFLKKNVLWHNNTSFNADDVVFTFNALTNPSYNSPLQRNFEGVSVKKIDDYTINITLNEPYVAFLELLTVGILPAQLWQPIAPEAAPLADLNIKPIGTGPYIFESLTKDKAGNIKSYQLKANKNYFDKKPYLTTLTFKFNLNFNDGLKALNEGTVEGIDYLPKEMADQIVAKNNFQQHFLQQPQFTALFFNQNNLGDLTDLRVKQALAHALDKKTIASTEYASVIDGPILPIFTEYYKNDIKKYEYDLNKATELLDEAGWKTTEVILPTEQKNPDEADTENATNNDSQQIMEPGTWRKKGDKFLELTITTVDQPETIQLAQLIKDSWSKLNIKVNVLIITPQTLQSQIIKPRAYQILLYGVILGTDPDQYLWHSSQISANGLNLSNYNNKQVDELLEDGRITNDVNIRREKYEKFQEIIINDLPAIFLYSQKYPYVQTVDIQGFDTTNITVSSDRFNNIVNWYIKTKNVFIWD